MLAKIKVKNYSLHKTLTSGQVFKWHKKSDHEFVGVIKESIIRLTDKKDELEIKISHGNITREEILHYLGIDEKYEDIVHILCSKNHNQIFHKSVKCFKGYRILRQDPFETLISFIDSANNNVSNICKQMNNLSRLFGKHLKDDFYAFPQANVLAALSEKEIKKAKVGFRGKYMIKTARQILEKGGCKVYFQSLESHKSEEIHKKLKELPGVGNKIADCVLLFAFNRLERVPIDVWTRRILKHAFDINLQSKYTNLQNDAQNIFGKYSGYAFSFLFEYVRKYGKQSLSA